jgi:hypothetical protein
MSTTTVDRNETVVTLELEQLRRLFHLSDPGATSALPPVGAIRPAFVLRVAAGIEVARRSDGSAAVPIEISPLRAHQLEALEYMDAIFPDLDYRLFAPAGGVAS